MPVWEKFSSEMTHALTMEHSTPNELQQGHNSATPLENSEFVEFHKWRNSEFSFSYIVNTETITNKNAVWIPNSELVPESLNSETLQLTYALHGVHDLVNPARE